jgi:hypothetical protein
MHVTLFVRCSAIRSDPPCGKRDLLVRALTDIWGVLNFQKSAHGSAHSVDFYINLAIFVDPIQTIQCSATGRVDRLGLVSLFPFEGRSIDIGRGRRTHRYRIRLEVVILNDQSGPWLRGIDAASDQPDLSALHSSQFAEIASTKASSPDRASASITSRDYRRASSAKRTELTSGTQIWMGRRPCSRSRARCAGIRSLAVMSIR